MGHGPSSGKDLFNGVTRALPTPGKPAQRSCNAGGYRIRALGYCLLAVNPSWVTLGPVASPQYDRQATPTAPNRWIEEVGEDYIADLVETTQRGVADGTITAFSDKKAFLRHLAGIAHSKPK